MNGHLADTQSLRAPLPTAKPHRTAPPAVLARLAQMAGVRFNGDRPWDIKGCDEALYGRILTGWSLGLGEAYMDGLWDAERLWKEAQTLEEAQLAKVDLICRKLEVAPGPAAP